MKLFPYALLRIGGESFAQLDKLLLVNSLEHVRDYHRQVACLNQVKEELCQALFDHIRSMDEKKDQNLLQNMRRDIFNERKLKSADLRAVEEILKDNPLGTRLSNYAQDLISVELQYEEGREAFQWETVKAREELKDISKSEALQKGLLLSSGSLLDRVLAYINLKSEKIRKKEMQTELSLIKYLSRIMAKTSPFSTFTNLATCAFASEEKSPKAFYITKNTGNKKVESHARLNNFLLNYLLNVFKNHPEMVSMFPIRPNPTIAESGEHYVFLVNQNNIESFQRIPMSPVIDLIHRKVSEQPEGVVLNETIAALVGDINASPEALKSYIVGLLDIGFFEFNFQVSGMDPGWDIALSKVLLPHQELREVRHLLEALESLRQMASSYETSDVNERRGIMHKAFETFNSSFHTLHKAAGLPEVERMTDEERKVFLKDREASETKEPTGNKESRENIAFKLKGSTFFQLKKEQLFYEDTTRETGLVLDKKVVGGLTEKLNLLFKDTTIMKLQEVERLKMMNYFTDKYKGVSEVSLLTFYEDYYRDFKQPEQEFILTRKRDTEKEGSNTAEGAGKFEIAEVKIREDRISKWNGLLYEILKGEITGSQGSVNITHKHLEKVNKQLQIDASATTEHFHGAFQQLFVDGGVPKMVLNSTFFGYGKMLSRFLHVFDRDVLDQTRHFNNSLSEEGVLFAEATDASYFNANLHPSLMPYEIWVPGGHNNVEEERQLAITDFVIRYDADQSELQLFHKPSDQRVYVFNLGFQNPKSRSQLFQLLETFTAANTGYPHIVIQPVNKVVDSISGENSGFKVHPRITFEEDIILQRKTWYFQNDQIPVKKPAEDDWAYFCRLRLWVDEHSLPENVFVNINPSRSMGSPNSGQMQKLTRDDYKPQYIDFRNLFLVRLFNKLANKAPAQVKIQEMLPGPDQLLKVDDESFVSEFVIQWTG